MMSFSRPDRPIFGTVLALAVAACGGEAVIDGSGVGGGSTTTTTTTTTTSVTYTNSTTSTSTSSSTGTNTTTAACLPSDDFCACWDKESCNPVGAGCLCHCDYQCPGEPMCECGCGGGDYLGCAPWDCPTLEFPEGTQVAFDDDGCPYQIN